MIDLARLPPDRPLVLLTDQPGHQSAIELRLAAVGTAGVSVTNGAGLARLVLERRLEGNLETAGSATRRRCLAATLDQDPGPFRTLYERAPRETISMLLPLVEEADMEEVDESKLAATDATLPVIRARFRSVRDLAGRYRPRLEREGPDDVTLLRRAAAPGPALPWTLVPLDTHIPRLIERMLAAFKVEKAAPAPPAKPPLDRIRVLRPRDDAEEAELVARLLIQADLPSWQDAAVVADAAAAPLVALELRAHGLPISASWSHALGTTGGWRLVASWFRILTNAFGPGDLAAALPGLASRADEGRALRLVRKALERWTSTLDALRALADQDSPLDLLLRDLPAAPDPLAWIRTNIAAPHDKRHFAAPTPESRALHREIHASINAIDAARGAADVLDEALRAAAPIEEGRPGAGVRVLPAAQDPGRDNRLLVATGFTRGRYPRPPAASPVLGDPERAAAGLPTSTAGLLDRRADLLDLLASSRGDIVFTAPQRRGGEWVEPSLFLDELLSLGLSKDRVVDLGAPGAAGPPPLRTRRGLVRDAADPAAARALAADPVSRDILEAPLRPSRDFRLGRAADLAGLSLSPSALAPSLGCRHHFFAAQLLGLQDAASAGRSTLGPLELGTAVHKVLERLAPEVAAGRATADRAVELLEPALRELYPWALSGRFGLAIASLQDVVRAFFPRYLELLKAVKGTPLQPELPLRTAAGERPLLPLPARPGVPAAVPVGGRIDQPLRLADGSGLVLDFKWGPVEKRIPARAAAGLETQGPLYAWFLREHGHPPPRGVLFVSVVADEAVFIPARDPGHVHFLAGGPDLESAERGLAGKIADLLAAFATPDADCSPVGDAAWKELAKAESNPCAYCSFGLLCRSRRTS